VSAIMPSPMPNPANEDTVGGVGVAFWHHDGDNYYIAFITPDGFAWISRRVNGNWTTLVDKISTPAIKTDAGLTNTIEVAGAVKAGVFVINDTKITDSHGQAPTDNQGGPPGIYAESGHTITTWVFPRMQLYSYTP